MIRTLRTAALSLTLLLACSSVALADGNAFTPLTFDDASYGTPKTTTVSPAKIQPQQDVVGSPKLQNAILELDNAQVEIRNQLLDYKAKYSDIDNQYKLIKSERKTLGKQVKSVEKRIKQIDKTKEKIRKQMNML